MITMLLTSTRMTINKLFTRHFRPLVWVMWNLLHPLLHPVLTLMASGARALRIGKSFDEVTSHPSGTANVAQGNKPWLLKIIKMMMRTTTWVSRMMPRMKMMSDLMG
jgi:hypothetical protein